MLGGRYQLLSEIGRGGMGRVWHAQDVLLHRDVAVKEVIFPPGLSSADREVLFERTMREARSAARLSHPGIVTVHDVVEEDGRPWIVMEFVRAQSLQEVIDGEGRLPVPRVAEIGAQMLAALRVAHASGVLHRDVKPANVLLDSRADGSTRVVITDFGIAQIEGDANLTQTGLVLGSPAYIAPERARGDGTSPASDLWALGATLYAACEGNSPHHRAEAMAALTAVLYEEPAPPRNAGPLGPVLMGLLAKDPANRLTADQAAADLDRAAHGEATTAAELPRSWSRESDEPDESVRELHGAVPGHASRSAPAPRHSRLKVLLAVAVVIVVVGGCVAALLMHQSAHGSPDPKSSTLAASASATPTPSPTLPAGFTRSVGPAGSSIAVPVGWTRQQRGPSSVIWTQPGTGAYVQVDTTPWGVPRPVIHWRRFESEVLAKNALPGFQEIRRSRRFDFRGWPAADLEYTWQTRDHGTMRAVDLGFTANGQQYAILVAGPKVRWGDYRAMRGPILDSFQPAG